MYTLLPNPNQVRFDPENVVFSCIDGVTYYDAYKLWLAQGNTPSPMSIADQKIAIQMQIDSLEREQLLPRVSREGLLLTMETFAAMQGITPAQLYTDNVAYHKVKDFDTQIALLRAQL